MCFFDIIVYIDEILFTPKKEKHAVNTQLDVKLFLVPAFDLVQGGLFFSSVLINISCGNVSAGVFSEKDSFLRRAHPNSLLALISSHDP